MAKLDKTDRRLRSVSYTFLALLLVFVVVVGVILMTGVLELRSYTRKLNRSHMDLCVVALSAPGARYTHDQAIEICRPVLTGVEP